MKLYYAKHTCAIGIHLLLEEIGAEFDIQELDFESDEQHGLEFLRINPKGKVPTLIRADGSALTEFGTIARWLAAEYPDNQLLPVDSEERARVEEVLDYAVGTLHGQAFARVFMPQRFAPTKNDHDAVRESGCKLANQGFEILAKALEHPAFDEDRISVADAALFYVENWARQMMRKMPIRLPVENKLHLDRMLSRPAVQRALKRGGYNT